MKHLTSETRTRYNNNQVFLNILNILVLFQKIAQIAKTIRSTSISYLSNTFESDRYIIDVGSLPSGWRFYMSGHRTVLNELSNCLHFLRPNFKYVNGISFLILFNSMGWFLGIHFDQPNSYYGPFLYQFYILKKGVSAESYRRSNWLYLCVWCRWWIECLLHGGSLFCV